MPQSVGLELLPVLQKRRWTTEDAKLVLKRLRESGLTVREFAAREGLDAQRLQRWRAMLGATAPAFMEIRRCTPATPVEIVLRSGHVLRVVDGFGEETVRRLLALLEDGGARC